jgi:hypothetical protein
VEQERAFQTDPVMAQIDLAFAWAELGLERP